jgi:hypothetical protein
MRNPSIDSSALDPGRHHFCQSGRFRHVVGHGSRGACAGLNLRLANRGSANHHPEEDCIIITADRLRSHHTAATRTREYVPILVYGKRLKEEPTWGRSSGRQWGRPSLRTSAAASRRKSFLSELR